MGRWLFASLFSLSLLIPSQVLAQGSEERPPAPEEKAPALEEKVPSTPAQAPAPTLEEKKEVKQISLKELKDLISYTHRGKVILLSFWSPYCGECLELLPMFSELYRNYRDQRFMVIGISLWGYHEKVWLSINRVRIDFPVFMGDADVLNAYDIHTLPAVIFIGRDGKEEEKAEGHEANRKAFDKEI